MQFIPPRMRPSPEACKALAEAMRAEGGERHGQAMWLMVAAGSSCGLRQGELWAAPVETLNGTDGMWFIDRQVVRVKGEGPVVTDPKWGRVRTTVLPELTMWGEPFRAPLLEYAKTRPAGGLLFPAPQGGFFHPGAR